MVKKRKQSFKAVIIIVVWRCFCSSSSCSKITWKSCHLRAFSRDQFIEIFTFQRCTISMNFTSYAFFHCYKQRTTCCSLNTQTTCKMLSYKCINVITEPSCKNELNERTNRRQEKKSHLKL